MDAAEGEDFVRSRSRPNHYDLTRSGILPLGCFLQAAGRRFYNGTFFARSSV